MSLRFVIFALLGGSFGFSHLAHAHFTLTDQDLTKYKVPTTPGLLNGKSPIVINKTKAIQLGKALFWDTNVGSNGVACATCHFHAGSDRRTVNQLNPGLLHLNNPLSSKRFDLPLNDGAPNHALTAEDFPFFRLQLPNDKNSKVIFETDDVVGSAGIYLQKFNSINPNPEEPDLCTPTGDAIHSIDGLQTRQVTKRNAPTVINAAFNRRNFWDGRANQEFNGVSAFGSRDVNAKIWIMQDGKPVSKKISLANASLASQAVVPPLDMIEMSCNGRTFKDIAKKLLSQKPLSTQEIHAEDSVLASLREPSGFGLSNTYEELIKKSFNPIYWSGTEPVQKVKGTNYSQMEANFSFFFGLAIQLYESTLISDQSKLDLAIPNMKKTGETVPSNFTEAEKKGLALFTDAHCNICHAGATFTTAVNYESNSPNAYKTNGSASLDRIGIIPSNSDDSVDSTLADIGFFNTSVVPDEYDVGLGGTDPWGNPLSYAQQYVNYLRYGSKKLVDNFLVLSCDFTRPFVLNFKDNEMVEDKKNLAGCSTFLNELGLGLVPKPIVVKQESATLDQGRLSTLTTGAFKIPTLRNVELTGPYMHNGGMKSLEEVAEFYGRGGNVTNRRHPGTLVFDQGFTQDDIKALTAFLKTLTDERVRWEKAPFDHPSIQVPNGHTQSANGNFMEDDYLMIPAVGKKGLSTDKGALMPFETYLK